MAAASLSVAFLAGCSGDDNKPEEKETQVETTSGVDEVGHVTEEDGYKKVLEYINKDFNKSDESGTFEFTIKSVRLESLTASTDVAARTYGVEKETESSVLTLDLSGINNGDRTVNCYISQATLTTDKGVTVEPKALLGKYIDGHFEYNVLKEGTNVYVFPGIKPSEINNLTFEVAAPKNNDFKEVGDPIELEFSLR